MRPGYAARRRSRGRRSATAAVCWTGAVRGYRSDSYGEAFADVYDDWYADVSPVDATVARLAALAGNGPVLELGIGTGRLALPLAAAGVEVHGVDTSAAMLEQLAAKPDAARVRATRGD